MKKCIKCNREIYYRWTGKCYYCAKRPHPLDPENVARDWLNGKITDSQSLDALSYSHKEPLMELLLASAEKVLAQAFLLSSWGNE